MKKLAKNSMKNKPNLLALSEKSGKIDEVGGLFGGMFGKMKKGISNGIKKTGFGMMHGIRKLKDFARGARITLGTTKNVDEVEMFKENQKMMVERSHELQFYTVCCDYIKLWVPEFLIPFSKRDLYLEVIQSV